MALGKKLILLLGLLQFVATPLALAAVQFIPVEDDRRFLVFFPNSMSDLGQMQAVLKSGAQPLSVEWHGGWVVETAGVSAIDTLKNSGAFLVLKGDGLGICGF